MFKPKRFKKKCTCGYSDRHLRRLVNKAAEEEFVDTHDIGSSNESDSSVINTNDVSSEVQQPFGLDGAMQFSLMDVHDPDLNEEKKTSNKDGTIGEVYADEQDELDNCSTKSITSEEQNLTTLNSSEYEEDEFLQSDVSSEDSFINDDMSNNDVDSECSECEDEDNDEDNEDNDEEFAEESSSAGGFFKNKLRQWAIKFNVTLIALSALLLILQPIVNFHLPLDARTLLGTLRKVNISEMGDGEYYHFGLKRAVEAIIRENRRIGRKVDKLELTFNIDGLPIFNSTTKGLWLILCSEINSQGVYPVGAFFGKGKPNDANEFIRELVNELVDLTQKGLDGENVEISCSALICDVPAKSFMLYLKGHMGYYSCSKCCIKGEYVASKKKQPAKSKGKGKGKGSGTVCFPGIGPFKMKTDEGFLRNDYDEFDTGNETILKEIPKFGCVSGVPLDYMHLILLGVVKKLINMWLAGPLKTRLSPAHISKISKKLVILRRSIPSEFGRRPRSIWDFRHWKATEFRTFLLYCGPVVLKNILPIVLYENFILLHSAVTILLNKLLFNMPGNISCAHEMLERFVTDFADIYGKKFVSHNVHNLLHICSDAEKYGTLDQFSAFKFENYMTSIRKMIRKGDKPLQQIARRYAESEEAEKKK